MKKDLLVIFGLFGLVIVLLIIGSLVHMFPQNQIPNQKTTVTIGDLKISAEVAKNPIQRAKGLSGRTNLPQNEAMLFVFDREDRYSFWMKNVKIPLDFIWISKDKTVADITPNVQPEPGRPDSQLRIYRPAVPVLYVLEVNAGLAQEKNVRIGDKVQFKLP